MTFSPLNIADDNHRAAPARWFCVRANKVLISDRAEFEGERHFIGVHDDSSCWALDVTDAADDATTGDGGFLDLFSLWGRAEEIDWVIAGRAVQIVEWARTHRFCGRCGTPTEPNGIDRSMKCPCCALLAFPRLAPAIITLVLRGDEALLGRGVNFSAPMYSALAGFVEPGESLEQALAREVREEVGVEVTNIRYVASQPWPFPHSLMLGFFADWAGGDIVIDPTEIADAQWFTADTLPMIPPGISIARKLIDRWLSGQR